MINGPTDASTAFNGAVVNGLSDRSNSSAVNNNTQNIIINTNPNSNNPRGMMAMSDPSMLHAFEEDLLHHHHPHHSHPHDMHSHPHYNYGNIQLLVVDQHVENELMHEHNVARRGQNFAPLKQELSYEEEADVNGSSQNHSIAPSSINPFSDATLSEISSPSQSRKRRKTNKVGPASKSNKHLKSSSEDAIGLVSASSPTTFKSSKPFAAGEVQAIKRQKCDLLKAFFRVYFIEDKNGSVLKDSIYILYAKKIAPSQCIARNAVYRHMWSYFKDKITASQSNYREFINGIRLNTSTQHLKAANLEKDVEILRSGLIENDLFGFTEEELGQVAIESDSSKNIKVDCEQPVSIHGMGSLGMSNLGGEKDLLQTVEHLEMVAMSLVSALADLKSKLKESKP